MNKQVFHASLDNLGKQVDFDSGGRYEKINKNGTPVQQTINMEHIGWEISDTPQLCASKSAAGAALAKMQHTTRNEPKHDYDDITIYLYEINQSPDVDISNAVTGDFSFLEEVRYNNPADDPIHGELAHTITFSPEVRQDIDLIYLPIGPYIIDQWGKAVKQGIDRKIKTGYYPHPIEEALNAERPDADKYKNMAAY